MELNLDDEYYQKYMKYKQRYHMLKQLKNNKQYEGEGGVFRTLLSSLGLVKSQQQIDDEKNQNNENANVGEVKPPINGYLVFHFPEEFLTQEDKVNNFQRVGGRASAINDDSDLFLSLDKFYEYYSDAYIITTEEEEDVEGNVKNVTKYKYIDKSSMGMNIEYEEFNKYIKDQQKLLTKVFEEGEEDDNNPKDDIKYIQAYNTDEINKIKGQENIDFKNANILNNLIVKTNDNIIQSINTFMNKLSNDFIQTPEIINLQKYSTKNLGMDFVDTENFLVPKIEGDKTIKENTFFTKFSSFIPANPLIKGNPNIVLHVRIENDKIYIEEFKPIIQSTMYYSIVTAISQFKKGNMAPAPAPA